MGKKNKGSVASGGVGLDEVKMLDVIEGSSVLTTTGNNKKSNRKPKQAVKPKKANWSKVDLDDNHLSTFSHSGFLGLEVLGDDDYITNGANNKRTKDDERDYDDKEFRAYKNINIYDDDDNPMSARETLSKGKGKGKRTSTTLTRDEKKKKQRMDEAMSKVEVPKILQNLNNKDNKDNKDNNNNKQAKKTTTTTTSAATTQQSKTSTTTTTTTNATTTTAAAASNKQQKQKKQQKEVVVAEDKMEVETEKAEVEESNEAAAESVKEKKAKKEKKPQTKKAIANIQKNEKFKKRSEQSLQKFLKEDEQEKVDISAWNQYDLDPLLVKGLKALGYGEPTEIQSQVIPAALKNGLDIIGAAETGSGKTLAFGIPMLHNILTYLRSINHPVEKQNINVDGKMKPLVEQDDEEEEEEEEEEETATRKQGHLYSLIMCPTRELAIQVANHLKSISYFTTISVVTVVGGMAAQKQIRLLGRRPEIVVATPGRLWELIQDGNEHLLDLTHLMCFGIDEADRMVEKGHFAEVDSILKMLPKYSSKLQQQREQQAAEEEEDKEEQEEEEDKEDGEVEDEEEKEERSNGFSYLSSFKRQTFIFSATLVGIPNINELNNDGKKPMGGNRKFKKKAASPLQELIGKVQFQRRYRLIDCTKSKLTARNLEETKIVCSVEERDMFLYYFVDRYPGRTLVFVNSIDSARRLLPILNNLKVPIFTLHAQMQQRQRLKNLDRFRNMEHVVLLATDVAARGLDIQNVQHVIHFQVPRSLELYIHRSGRTARSKREGFSLVMVTPKENDLYNKLARSLEHEIPTFPIDLKYLDAIKTRVELAIQIDKLTHQTKKENAEKNWFMNTAREMDIALDDDFYPDSDNEDEQMENMKQQNKLNSLRHRLTELLQQNIRPRGQSTRYITAESIAEMESKENATPNSDLKNKLNKKKNKK
ncbi:putative RNA helicase [Heterostelium album PN500]|uniref:ATP-dependent RNA helicase n=1 Tax=Heterostelium pallidum (strain ATCC 26659 / Pp 5 / PN500) TaxID=670386 RepID=D3B9K7_HETP5|nr:putative RNA helicase [Heterostelium album PN500]EFA81919.1 putative RNA helicase [Heterostelium album PN500]|eukprot:XP_020434036.1 putative RNA helicase [Heterostelium album PN500]